MSSKSPPEDFPPLPEYEPPPPIPDAPEPEELLLGHRRLSPEEEEAFRKREREKDLLQQYMLRDLMRRESFRRWLWTLLESFNTFGRTFGVSPTGFPDRDATEYALGMKAAGWHIWTMFDDAAPDLASEMRREFSKPKI